MTRSALWGVFAVCLLVVLTSCEGSYRARVTVGTLSIPAGGAGVVRISLLNPPDAQMIQVGPVGLLTFDPAVIQVTGLTGVNGFTVFSSTINTSMGWVQFVASFPGGSIRPLVGLGVLEIPIIEMSVQAVGAVGSQTDLVITAIDVFTDRVGQPIPTGSPQPGKVVIIAP